MSISKFTHETFHTLRETSLNDGEISVQKKTTTDDTNHQTDKKSPEKDTIHINFCETQRKLLLEHEKSDELINGSEESYQDLVGAVADHGNIKNFIIAKDTLKHIVANCYKALEDNMSAKLKARQGELDSLSYATVGTAAVGGGPISHASNMVASGIVVTSLELSRLQVSKQMKALQNYIANTKEGDLHLDHPPSDKDIRNIIDALKYFKDNKLPLIPYHAMDKTELDSTVDRLRKLNEPKLEHEKNIHKRVANAIRDKSVATAKHLASQPKSLWQEFYALPKTLMETTKSYDQCLGTVFNPKSALKKLSTSSAALFAGRSVTAAGELYFISNSFMGAGGGFSVNESITVSVGVGILCKALAGLSSMSANKELGKDAAHVAKDAGVESVSQSVLNTAKPAIKTARAKASIVAHEFKNIAVQDLPAAALAAGLHSPTYSTAHTAQATKPPIELHITLNDKNDKTWSAKDTDPKISYTQGKIPSCGL